MSENLQSSSTVEKKRKHILVVDENESTKHLVVSALHSRQREVFAAANVAVALEQMSRNTPSLLITSLFLKSSDVVQLIVRTRVLYPNVKVVGIYDSRSCPPKELQLQRRIIRKLGVMADFDIDQLDDEIVDELIALMDDESRETNRLTTVVNNPEKVPEPSATEATIAPSIPTKVVQR